MNILFFTLTPFGGMYEQLADEFASHGHKVVFVTPHTGNTVFEERKGYHALLFKSGKMYGVGRIQRFISELSFPFRAKNAVQQYINPSEYDLILLSTPSIGFYKAIEYIKRKNRAIKFYLILRDIHPEGAKFAGLDKIQPLYKHFENQAKTVYAIADKIGCMSPHSVTLIRDNYLSATPDKVELLPNWGKVIPYVQVDGTIREKYGLEGKFLLIYGGNMARIQNIPFMLKLAEMKLDLDDVVFLFVGDGAEKQKLREIVEAKKLTNVKIWDSLPKEDYDELLRSADVGIVTLHPKAFFANIPSKTISYLQYRVPILASVDRVGDYNDFIIERSKAGLWNYSDDIESLSQNFDKLYHNPSLRKKMGENGYSFFMNNFRVENTYETIMSSIS